MKAEQIPIAREGYPFILTGCFATLVLALLHLTGWALAGLVLTGFVLWFFRDPARTGPHAENGVVCPADGKIIVIRDVDDERFLHGRATKVSIFMNVFNVHVNRIPCDGQVTSILFKPGKFYAADREKAALHNEYCGLILDTGNHRLAVVQVAGLIARRIVCRAEPGDQVRAGQRYGLIRFGSRVDLYLPPDTVIEAQLGQKVRAGETRLARLPAS